MDNNFSRILDIFKTLDEGSMASAEKHSTGPKFTGYWKGTDPRTPGQHMVGAAESVETECEEPMTLADKLRARWEETKRQKGLQEYGAPGTASAGGGAGGGTTSTNPVDQAKAAKEFNLAQSNLNKLKSAGVNLPTGVSQAAKSAVTTAKNPGAVAGQGMDMAAKKTATALGQEMEKLVTGGDPGQISQLANAIKKMNMGQQ